MQSKSKTINVFWGKIETVQFTNIYKHNFTWYKYDNLDNEN